MAAFWQRKTPGEVQFQSPEKSYRQFENQLMTNSMSKSAKKTVSFNLRTSTAKNKRIPTHRDFLDYNATTPSNITGTSYFNSSNMVTYEKTPVYRGGLCTSRGTAMTFFIIVLLIIIAGITMGVVFGSIGSHNNKSTTTTAQTGLQNLSVTVSTPAAVTTSISVGSQSGPPCSSYTTINDPTRNYAQRSVYGSCDNGPIFNATNGNAWIRFTGSGGTQMATTAPNSHGCGAFLSIWYNGTLPSAGGSIDTGILCVRSDSDTCSLPYNTTVTDCTGGVYIYLLQPAPMCNARYCTQ